MPKPTPISRPRLQAFMLATVIAATVAGATVAGWVDLHNPNVETSVVTILAVSFLITALFRRGGWLGGLLVGLGIPVAQLYAHVAGIGMPSPSPHQVTALLALGLAAVGMIVGLALRTGIAEMRH